MRQRRFRRLFLLGNAFGIHHHLADEGISVQCVGINDFTVYDSGFSKPLPYFDGVNIVEVIQLLICKKAVIFQQRNHPALYITPGDFCLLHTGQTNRKGVQIAAELIPQPLRGRPFTVMLTHIPDYLALAGNIAVPCLNCRRYIFLSRGTLRYDGDESAAAVRTELCFMRVDSPRRFMVNRENTAYLIAAVFTA